MVYEHRIKEKEYGIKWRQAFKSELAAEAGMLRGRFGNHLGDREFSDNNFVITELVHKDFFDIKTLVNSKQLDMMLMLNENIC